MFATKRAKATGKKRVVPILLAAALAVSLMTFAAVPAGAVPNADYAARTSLQPYGHQFHLSELMNWTPESDPDARYNISKVPLAERYTGSLVNPNASAQVKVNNTAISNQHTTKAPSQGSNSSDVYSFTYWQYVDTYTYWGGSGGEGIFCIPTAEVIDAAHKNGVPITGTVFFPQDSSHTEWLRTFAAQAPDGSYPVADKMLEMAAYYGFDGYFFNEETSGFNATDSANMRRAMQYMQDHKPSANFQVIWYDSMTVNGYVSWQNQLNAQNGAFLQEGTKRTSDYMFLNFNWNNSYITNSVNHANSLGRSPFDVLATWDVQGGAYNTSGLNSKLAVAREGGAATGKPRISLGFYCPNSTLSMSKNANDFLNVHDSRFWTGVNGDPSVSDTRTTGNWVGVAQFAADRTAATKLPFVTSFNTGLGYNYYQNGWIAKTGNWSNRSMQDILPTWRWIVQSDGSKLTASFDLTDAWLGGTSLKLAGNLTAGKPNTIKLFSTKLDLKAGKIYELKAAYKGSANEKSSAKIGLYTTPDYSQVQWINVYLSGSPSNRWMTMASILDMEAADRTIYGLALQLESAEDLADFRFNLGQLGLYENGTDEIPMATPATVTLDDYLVHDAKNAEARVYWDEIKDPKFDHYNVYQTSGDGTRRYLGATINNAYYIPDIIHEAGSDDITIEVVPVDKMMWENSASAKLTFNYTMGVAATEVDETPPPVNLALNAPATASAANAAEPAISGVDGNYLSKWCTTNSTGWLRVDLGQPTAVQRWVVEHAGATEGAAMNTKDFSLEYSDTGGTGAAEWTEAMRVRNNAANHTDFNLAAPITARYWRLRVYVNTNGSPWGAVRIYEFELYRDTFTPKTRNLSMENVRVVGDKAVFRNVPSGTTVSVYNALDAAAPVTAGVSTGAVLELSGLGLNAAGGRLYYDLNLPGNLRSDRLSVPYEAASAAKTAMPAVADMDILAVRIVRDPALSGTINNNATNFGVLVMKGADGSNARLYASVADTFPTKGSAPATNGAARLEALPLNKTGGYLWATLHQVGLKESAPFQVYYHADGRYDIYRTELQTVVNRAQNVLPEVEYSLQTWPPYAQKMAASRAALSDLAAPDAVVEPLIAELRAAYEGLIRRAKTLKLGDATAVMLKRGRTMKLTATTTPMAVDPKTLLWNTNNQTVATVDQSGIVTGLKAGMTMVTVKALDGSNLSRQIVVNVVS